MQWLGTQTAGGRGRCRGAVETPPDDRGLENCPALAAGNSVVLKSSEDASLALLRLAQLCLHAGLPEGVLNLRTGSGAEAGDALRLDNDSPYGLAAAVWTGNLSRTHRRVRAINAGVMHVNTYGGTDITLPLGGMKQSGNSHDKSIHALEKCLDLKTAWIQL